MRVKKGETMRHECRQKDNVMQDGFVNVYMS